METGHLSGSLPRDSLHEIKLIESGPNSSPRTPFSGSGESVAPALLAADLACAFLRPKASGTLNVKSWSTLKWPNHKFQIPIDVSQSQMEWHANPSLIRHVEPESAKDTEKHELNTTSAVTSTSITMPRASWHPGILAALGESRVAGVLQSREDYQMQDPSVYFCNPLTVGLWMCQEGLSYCSCNTN